MNTLITHQPVLTAEVVAGLAVRADGIYLDATFGRGGHTAAILNKLGNNGRLLAFDRDPAAVRYAQEHFGNDPRFAIEHRRFSLMGEAVTRRGWQGQVGGIVFDLGVATTQLDDPTRGFSFLRPGPLDMRMDPTAGISAAQWLARASESEITKLLREYGEERFAGRIARAIINIRRSKPLTTTTDLVEIVARVVPREREKHPATRVFQALRIEINQELNELQAALPVAEEILPPGGRLAVVSFHSLEDRIVKRFLRADVDQLPRDLPVIPPPQVRRWQALGGITRPSDIEIATNPRARSAILRVAERL